MNSKLKLRPKLDHGMEMDVKEGNGLTSNKRKRYEDEKTTGLCFLNSKEFYLAILGSIKIIKRYELITIRQTVTASIV